MTPQEYAKVEAEMKASITALNDALVRTLADTIIAHNMRYIEVAAGAGEFAARALGMCVKSGSLSKDRVLDLLDMIRDCIQNLDVDATLAVHQQVAGKIPVDPKEWN